MRTTSSSGTTNTLPSPIFPIWNATPLVALDVYEHAYFLDYQTDRASYIDAFFANMDWATVNDWVAKYQVPLR